MNKSERAERHRQWQKWVEEHEKSGLSQKTFCKQNNLVLSHFGYYRSIFKAEKHNHSVDAKILLPLQMKKPIPTASAEMRIVLPNGFQCFFPFAAEPSRVKQFVEALLSC